MESNYYDIQTPRPITAHNYKVVKVIKEPRELANGKTNRTFRQWVPASRVLGIKSKIWRQMEAQSGATHASRPPAPKKVGGRKNKNVFPDWNVKGRVWAGHQDRKTGL